MSYWIIMELNAFQFQMTKRTPVIQPLKNLPAYVLIVMNAEIQTGVYRREMN